MPEPSPAPPERHQGRTAALRVLLVTAVIPVLFAVGLQLPRYRQDPVMITALWLVVLLPMAALAVAALAYRRGQRRAALGYVVGACLAVVIGFLSWVAASLEAM